MKDEYLLDILFSFFLFFFHIFCDDDTMYGLIWLFLFISNCYHNSEKE
uniref:Uncharacterized protein n=1 Tax=viral metagenome TaxID=1070528 RepID=A0A6C0KXF9_9ZZZZ